jgi:hypothetical protein
VNFKDILLAIWVSAALSVAVGLIMIQDTYPGVLGVLIIFTGCLGWPLILIILLLGSLIPL